MLAQGRCHVYTFRLNKWESKWGQFLFLAEHGQMGAEHLNIFEPGHDLVSIFGMPIDTFTSLEETEAWLGISIANLSL